jgi:hypothetical protein
VVTNLRFRSENEHFFNFPKLFLSKCREGKNAFCESTCNFASSTVLRLRSLLGLANNSLTVVTASTVTHSFAVADPHSFDPDPEF